MSKKMQRDKRKLEGKQVSGRHKKFSQETYNRTAAAVDAIIDWYREQELYLEHNTLDPYGPDAVEWIGFRPVRYLEVAQRSAWKSGEWPAKWDPINIEERKLALFKLSLPCDYWVVSGDYKHALKISHEVVEKYISNLEEVSNAIFRSGEKFIRVPLSEFEHVDLDIVGTILEENRELLDKLTEND